MEPFGSENMARMKRPWRIFFGSNGVLLAVVGAIAFVAVINTWRLYSLPLTSTLVLGSVTAVISLAGIWSLKIAIQGKTHSCLRKKEIGIRD